MADPTKRPIPKFTSLLEVRFWENVYVASIRAMSSGGDACAVADRAVERRQERMSEELTESGGFNFGED